jgi:DNA uptake protein ComE-like DNA-binding protein
MKRFFKAYTSFTRTERWGVIGLLSVLLVLLIVRATIELWVHPKTNDAQEKALQTAWANYKKEHNETTSETNYTNTKDKHTPALNTGLDSNAQLFAFDPNTLDSADFCRLGLKEKTTAILLHWRAKGKKFYTKEDLQGLYSLTLADYVRLEPYIVINNNPKNHEPKLDILPPMPDVIDLNTADSVTLTRLKGIGAKIAHKILLRRQTEGKFTNIEQLKEVYHFPATTFNQLKEHVRVGK